MALYEQVFNGKTIYESLFFNVKSVLIYPTLTELQEANPALYENWRTISKAKYSDAGVSAEYAQMQYEDKGIYYPEFTRIVAITYATIHLKNGEMDRNFKKIANQNEAIVIDSFMDVLDFFSSEGVQSNPKFFPMFCGHNIIANDIPLLVKRFIINRPELKHKKLPYMLKRVLDLKPWESDMIDVINVWKFNGFQNGNLMLISDYMGLKKTTDLLPANELSKYYWRNIGEDTEKTLKFITHQSATQTNLVIQLMNELRQL